MSKDLNLSSKLDFSEIDMTAPDKVIEEILLQLPEETQGMIYGSIATYDGPVNSYTSTRSSLAEAFATITTERHVDIQDSLGKCGEEDRKFECFLYTPMFNKYKYRIFFMKYEIANYPVQFTLEESIARSINDNNSQYIFICNNRAEVEELLVRILTSKKVLDVMQELIRIYQSKKNEGNFDLRDETNNVESNN